MAQVRLVVNRCFLFSYVETFDKITQLFNVAIALIVGLLYKGKDLDLAMAM